MKRKYFKNRNKIENYYFRVLSGFIAENYLRMKKCLTITGIILFMGFSAGLRGQVLNVGEFIQEQDQWCWAGSSACVLDYFCTPTSQCTIAEYTREVATWHNFGSTDCCVNPYLGCNYWNYNWGYAGSIQDILVHFASINNTGVYTYLSTDQIHTRIQGNRPFIFRWGWTTGGGHFLVGYGLVNMDMYYMNPWFGEGLTISDYNWVVSNPDHTWTHTNDIVTPSPRPYPVLSLSGPQLIIMGSTAVNYTTETLTNATSYIWEINPSDAGSIVSSGTTGILSLSNTFTGLLFVKVKGHNTCGDGASDSLVVMVYNPAIIVPLTGETFVKIYPVPGNGIIHIDCGQPDPGRWLEILSMTGQQIIKIPVPGKQSTLDLSNQPRGFYFGKITGTGVNQVMKLILQ
jgi:hypothetical protein